MRARRVDQNCAEIRDGLRALGYSVIVWNGVCDLVVGHAGRTYLLEVKNPARTPSGLRQDAAKTISQQKMRAEWKGQWAVVKTLDEALAVMGYQGCDWPSAGTSSTRPSPNREGGGAMT